MCQGGQLLHCLNDPLPFCQRLLNLITLPPPSEEAYFNFRLQLTQSILTSEDSFDPLASQTESWFLIDFGKYWLWLEFPFQEVKERSRSRAGATSRNRLWSRTISRGKDCWAVAASKKDSPVKPCSTSSIQDILQCRTVLFIALSSGNQLVTNCTQQLVDWLDCLMIQLELESQIFESLFQRQPRKAP